MKTGVPFGTPALMSLARPERLRRTLRCCGAPLGPFHARPEARARNVLPRWRAVVELPTIWFVGRPGFSRLFQFNKIYGPLSA